ncbi:hypothetical protein MASR2M69_02600 [Bacteroidota bacterium]
MLASMIKTAATALIGGFYIYNCAEIGVNQSIQPIKKFENITTRPVQILYKSTVWDKPVVNSNMKNTIV